MVRIEDGTGKGFSTQVDKNHHLHVEATSLPVQTVASQRDEQAYQVIGDYTITGSGTFNTLHIANNNENLSMIVTFMRVEGVGLTGGTYGTSTVWEIGNNSVFSTGGTEVTPINVNLASGNDADVTAHDNNPTLTGTFIPIDKFYPKENNQMERFNKEGSLVLRKNDALTLRFTTDHTAGLAYSRVSFYMAETEDE